MKTYPDLSTLKAFLKPVIMNIILNDQNVLDKILQYMTDGKDEVIVIPCLHGNLVFYYDGLHSNVQMDICTNTQLDEFTVTRRMKLRDLFTTIGMKQNLK